MAELADETVNIAFNLQRLFLKHVDSATAMEAALFERFGETEDTILELEQLQNIRERGTAFYARLHVLLLRIAEAQPVATYATLDLVARTIEEGQATDAAIAASLQETRRNWSLP